MDSDIQKQIQDLQAQLESQKKVTHNAIKLSIIVGFVSIFFVVLNLSILFTVAGGIAGSDRKLEVLQEQSAILQKMINQQKTQH